MVMLNFRLDPKPRAGRVVLVGASNLTRGISTVVHWSQRLVGQPLDFYVAFGHGRSYGVKTEVFYRGLPGIIECGLWPELERAAPLPTYGLITDVGNDLLYQYKNAKILPWVEHCLGQLTKLGARIVLVQLPVETVLQATELQLWFLRTFLFPNRQYSLEALKAQALELAAGLAALAKQYGATLVEQERRWYGIDPIHLKMSYWDEAWGKMLAPWGRELPQAPMLRRPVHQWAYLRSLVPEQRWWFGYEHGMKQPVGKLADGSRIYLY